MRRAVVVALHLVDPVAGEPRAAAIQRPSRTPYHLRRAVDRPATFRTRFHPMRPTASRLAVIAVAQIAAGAALGLPGAALLWSGTAWGVVAAGYAGAGPRVFGKREDGSLRAAHIALLLPFLLVAWGAWWLRRSPTCGHEVAPGLWLGRRPLTGEIPAGVAAVVDLTSEFSRSSGVAGRAYLCLPTLDHSAPDVRALHGAVAWIDAAPGPVFVHCAAGYGRSATVVAAALIARGRATDATAAMEIVRASRRYARLNEEQARVLAAFAAEVAALRSM